MKKLLMCAVMMSMQCHAITYQWPYVQSVDVKITGAKTAIYTLHMGTATVTDDAINDAITVTDVLTRHGLVLGTKWVWGIYHRHAQQLDGSSDVASLQMVASTRDEKWKQWAASLASRYGRGTLQYEHRGVKNGDECIGTTTWGSVSETTPWDQWPAYNWNGGVTGSCVGTPPVDQWCAMKTPTIEIAYGTITLKDAEGSERDTRVTVECTTGMQYTLRLRDANNETTLNNGGHVTWQAGGQALGGTLSGAAGENSVDLTATLHGPFERTGEFNGSGILFVSYP